MPTLSKNTTYNQFVHGDFDRDGTPNIDDKQPFNPKESHQAQEVSLSRELKEIKKHNQQFRRLINKVIKKYKKDHKVIYRIKGTHSTIGKLRRRHIEKLKDIGAITIIGKNQKDLKNIRKYIRKNFRVIREKDFYQQPVKDHKYYKAIHIVVSVNKKPVEIQIKTAGHQKLHLETHPEYKTYRKLHQKTHRRLIKKSREITRREG